MADPNQVDLLLIFYNEIGDEELLDLCHEVLSEAETAQATRFHFEKDRKRYLATRASVRALLARYLLVAPGACRFQFNEFGRPEVANREAVSARLSFNISHTDELIAICVSRSRPVGVDVEGVRENRKLFEIADQFFAPDEIADFTATPEAEKSLRFFQYWTLKESYIKARGMGLSIPLDKFSFEFGDSRNVRLSIHPELHDDPSRWRFWQFRVAPNFIISVCAEQQSNEALTLVVGKMTPYASIRSAGSNHSGATPS